MARDRETLGAKVRRLERENRVWREREQDWEERSRGPADIEGYGNRVAVTIYLHKNLGEAKRIIDDFPNIPGLRPEGDPTVPRSGFGRRSTTSGARAPRCSSAPSWSVPTTR